MRFVIVFLILLSGFGCAFKQSDQHSASPAAAVSDVVGQVEMTYASTAATDSNNMSKVTRSVKHVDQHRLVNDTPLFLPVNVPTELKFSIHLTSVINDLVSIDGFWSKTASHQDQISANISSVVLALGATGGADIQFSVQLDPTLFDPNQESIADLSLILHSSAGDPNTFEMSFQTPPSKIQGLQETLAEYEARAGHVSDDKKILRSVQFESYLIQTLEFSNSSSLPVSVKLPIELSGKLWTHFKKVDLNQQVCSYSLNAQEWDDVLADRIDLVPIDLVDGKSISEFLINNLQDRFYELIIPAGQKRLLGIYASGNHMPKFASGGYSQQTLSPMQAVSSCHSECKGPGWDFQSQATCHWYARGFPGNSKICTQASPQNPDLMNQCALWEVSNGVGPNDWQNRFCLGFLDRPSVETWVITKMNVTVQVGVESQPIYLDLTTSTFSAKFAIGSGSDIPSRDLTALISPRTILNSPGI